MPFISGGSLRERLEQQGRFSIEQTLHVGHQIAEGLAAAHAQGLVHRDIKPANILFSADHEHIVITDFGLARAADDASITQTGILAGTPHFMSPEQAKGEPIDGRSDLFSLGSLLFTLVTGQVPFHAESSFGVLRQITDHAAPRVSELEPVAPAWLDNLISKLHTRQPDGRYASAEELSRLTSSCLDAERDPTKSIPEELLPTKRAWPRVLAAACILLAMIGLSVAMRPTTESSLTGNTAGNVAIDTEGQVFELSLIHI